MGAVCGTQTKEEQSNTQPAPKDGDKAAAAQPNGAAQPQQQQQPQQADAGAAAPAAASNGDAAASAAASSSGGIDEADVNVSVGAAEPEFKDGDAAQQANGDEAYSFWNRNKTFKPERQLPAGSKASNLQHTMVATMRATLGGGELQNTVKLPEGEDLNEWIAVNTVHFFNAASMIYGTCTQFCTDLSCPTMAAGKAEYLWKDNVNYKKPTRVTAPVYIDLLLSWADERISNPILFPVEQNAKFPRQFLSEVKQIYKRLFRLYAHLYCTHSEKIRSIGANAHLNTCFKHFLYFILEFNLMDAAEMQPLEKLINKLREAKARK